MKKSRQYNQQTKSKHCKSEVEEIWYVFTKTWKLTPSQQLHLKINSEFHATENPSEAAISENSQIRELHETINFFKLLFAKVFAWGEVINAFMKTKVNGEIIYKLVKV